MQCIRGILTISVTRLQAVKQEKFIKFAGSCIGGAWY